MNTRGEPVRERRAYRSPAREARKEATRRRILDALATHMAEGTFDSVSMDEIARAADVSPATLYRYFPSREALLDGIAHDALYFRFGALPFPETPGEIADVMRHSFQAFDGDRAFVRAYF